jgi:hypothetical protein
MSATIIFVTLRDRMHDVQHHDNGPLSLHANFSIASRIVVVQWTLAAIQHDMQGSGHPNGWVERVSVLASPKGIGRGFAAERRCQCYRGIE